MTLRSFSLLQAFLGFCEFFLFAFSSRIDLDILFSLHASVSSGLCHLFLKSCLEGFHAVTVFGSTLTDPDPAFYRNADPDAGLVSSPEFFFYVSPSLNFHLSIEKTTEIS